MNRYRLLDDPIPIEAETFGRLSFIRSEIKTREEKTNYFLKLWRGKSKRPKSFAFRSSKSLDAYIAHLKEGETTHVVEKAKRARRRKDETTEMSKKITVGTLLVCSWGYDQTNVDFYQVVEKKGLQVKIREIKAQPDLFPQTSEPSSFTQILSPVPGAFVKDRDVLTKRIGPWGLSMKYGTASPTEAHRRHHSTSYA